MIDDIAVHCFTLQFALFLIYLSSAHPRALNDCEWQAIAAKKLMIKLVTFQVKSSCIHHLEEQTFKSVALTLGPQIQRECFHYREAVKSDLDKDKSIYWIMKRIKHSC